MNAAPLEHFERWDIHKEGTQPADAPRHRCARRRAHRGARGARLRRAALSARRPLRQRGRGMDVRPRLARQAHRVGRLARADRADRSTATCSRTCASASPSSPRSASWPASRRRWRALCSPSARRSAARTSWRPAARWRASASAISTRRAAAPAARGLPVSARADDRLPRRRPHGARHRRRVRLCRPSRRDRRRQAARRRRLCATLAAEAHRRGARHAGHARRLRPVRAQPPSTAIAARVSVVGEADARPRLPTRPSSSRACRRCSTSSARCSRAPPPLAGPDADHRLDHLDHPGR